MSSLRANRGPVRRHFYNVPAAAVDCKNQWECDTIPSSRSLHSIGSVTATDPTKLMVRFFSCFCGSCRSQMWDDYENKNHVEPWRLVKIKPRNSRVVRQHMIDGLSLADDSQFASEAHDVSIDLHIGDNFVVPAEEDNDEGVRYYIL
jgi:hypothetical protein